MSTIDRVAVLEELKFWLQSAIDFGDFLEPVEVLDKIAELEELYLE